MLAKILTKILTELERIHGRLASIEAQGKATMSALDDLTSALDQETTAIATRLDTLTMELAAANQAPTAAQLAALSAISDRLKSLGADPAAPIPAPVPAPPTPPAAPVTPAPAA